MFTTAWTGLVLAALGAAFAGRLFVVLGAVSAVLILAGVLSPLDLPLVDTANFVAYILWSGWLVIFAGVLVVQQRRRTNGRAGIGRVESNHGRFGGAVLQPDGSAVPKIIGPALNGVGFAYIADTDHGVWDTDTVYDRAVGPMQFIPGTWRSYGISASGGSGLGDPANPDTAGGTEHGPQD